MKSQWSPTGRQAGVSTGTLDSGGKQAGVGKGRNQEIRKNNAEKLDGSNNLPSCLCFFSARAVQLFTPQL